MRDPPGVPQFPAARAGVMSCLHVNHSLRQVRIRAVVYRQHSGRTSPARPAQRNTMWVKAFRQGCMGVKICIAMETLGNVQIVTDDECLEALKSGKT